jgi:hypothetical protein
MKASVVAITAIEVQPPELKAINTPLPLFLQRTRWVAFAIAVAAIGCGATSAFAQDQKIANNVAVFSALDKVTATIKKLEIPIGETVAFGALKVTPRVCYSRPATEQPKTTTFVQVDEVQLDGAETRIFSGWMFAESPGLNAVEHPVFDVWLTDCAKPKASSVARQSGGDNATSDGEARPRQTFRRRRIRR